MSKLYCYSKSEFDILCEESGWTNYENTGGDKCFISIIGTPECQEHYLQEEENHWFKESMPNVLNLEFDDVEEDTEWKGHLFKAMSDSQASECLNFILSNIGKDFYIHCRAGKSRSQGVVRFILDMFPKDYSVNDTRPDNPCTSPNMNVTIKLKRAYYNKYGLYLPDDSEF